MSSILMTHILFQTVISVLIIWYICFHFRRRKLYKLAKAFNGPTPLPVIGNALKCFVPSTEITDKVLEGATYYQSPARLWFGPHLIIHVWDPENIELVLKSPYALAKQPYLCKLMKFVIGQGLITLPVDQWKWHRRAITPMFNQKYLQSIFEVFCDYSQVLIADLKEKADNKVFDVLDDLARYAFQSALATILDFNDNDNSTYNIHDAYESFKVMSYSVVDRMTNPLYASDLLFSLTPYGKRVLQARDNYQNFIASVLDNWEKNSMEKHRNNNDCESETGTYKPKKFIDHLVSTFDGNGKFTLEELRGEVNNFLAASLETISSTIGFTLLLLGTYPEAQEKVYQEAKEVYGNRPRIDFEDLKKLHYLERVVKEVLRLYPGLIGLARHASQDIALKNHTIPAGSTVLLGMFSIHRDPQIWSNPSQFDPDRFIPEEDAKRHPYSYFPFSLGVRNCVGTRFAWISLKVALTTILLNYKVATTYKSVDDIGIDMMVVFEPADGYKISLSPR